MRQRLMRRKSYFIRDPMSRGKHEQRETPLHEDRDVRPDKEGTETLKWSSATGQQARLKTDLDATRSRAWRPVS